MNENPPALEATQATAALAGTANDATRSRAHVIADEAEALSRAKGLAESFAAGAARRDRERILPVAEIEQFSQSGLWAVTVPKEFGGADLPYRAVAKIIDMIAAADPSIGQIPQNHLAMMYQLRAVGSAEQKARLFGAVLRGARFGNALAELSDKAAHKFTTVMQALPGGYRLSGQKYYSTGALFADFISVGALDEQGRRLTAVISKDAAGVTIIDDWSSFGQRTTASGTVILDNVFVPDEDVLPIYRAEHEPIAFGAVAQLLQAAIDSGIAAGALADTKHLVRHVARPWRDSGSVHAYEDPHSIAKIGRLQMDLHAAQAMLARAGDFVDRAVRAPSHRVAAEASIAVAEAKVLTTNIALAAANTLFELAGTRTTLDGQFYDRHWRNARVHTLHDPVRWKYSVVGDWYLNDRAPPKHGLV